VYDRNRCGIVLSALLGYTDIFFFDGIDRVGYDGIEREHRTARCEKSAGARAQ